MRRRARTTLSSIVPLAATRNNCYSPPSENAETDVRHRSGEAAVLGSTPFVPTFMKCLFFVGVSFALFYAVTSRGNYDDDTALIPARLNLNANATARSSVGRPFPTAVLHVGPPKTGSSSIQSALNQPQYLRALAADNYAVPLPDKHYVITNCAKDRRSNKCRGRRGAWTSAVRSYRDARNVTRTNVVFSCELLDQFNTPSDFDSLDEMLGDYRLNIVVVYRRFYDWLYSYYGQCRRGSGRAWSLRIKTWNSRVSDKFDNTNIVSWLQGDHIDMLFDLYYSTTVYQNYARRYGDDNVTLLNFHDGDVVETFFCNEGGLRSPSACELRRSGTIPQGSSNRGASTDYDELAFAAYDRGLLTPSSYYTSKNWTSTWGGGKKGRAKAYKKAVVVRPEAYEAIRYHHEVVLNRTSEDFARICLPTETLNRIYQLSLEAERMYMPEFFNSTRGKHVLQSDFRARSGTMFCSVDVDSVLNESTWKEFFLGLVESRVKFEEGIIILRHNQSP